MADDRTESMPAAESAHAADAKAPATEAVVDPDEAMKAKFRDAMAHKHGSSGAHKSAHGDQGESVHSQSNGPTQKLFRRKAGG